jgi:O-antigen ligase
LRYSTTLSKAKTTSVNGKVDLSGRDQLMLYDLEAFEKHPFLGCGPEGSARYRGMEKGEWVTAHTEYSRMLGDHGSLGLIALIILFSSSYRYIRRRKGNNKILIVGFIVIALFTMAHSAMRLAIPALAFGLGLMQVNMDEHSLERSKP